MEISPKLLKLFSRKRGIPVNGKQETTKDPNGANKNKTSKISHDEMAVSAQEFTGYSSTERENKTLIDNSGHSSSFPCLYTQTPGNGEKKMTRDTSLYPSIRNTLIRFGTTRLMGKTTQSKPKSSNTATRERSEKNLLDLRGSESNDDCTEDDGNSSEVHSFLDALFQPDFTNILAACSALLNSDEMPTFASCVVKVFDDNSLALSLIQTAISHEVQKTEEEGTLLRSTSVATTLMSAYGRLVGDGFLVRLLKTLLFDFYSEKDSYEIDPMRVKDRKKIEKNMNNLYHLTKSFLDFLCGSINECPRQMRQLCTVLRKEVSKKFPSSHLSSVGGFFFLRFICPAIVTPEQFGVIDSVLANKRRVLILVSKLLQSLTNGIPFGEKESYMVPLNQFLYENTNLVSQFFECLTSSEVPTLRTNPDIIVDKKCVSYLYQCILNNRKSIEHEISSQPSKYFFPSSLESSQRLFTSEDSQF